MIWYSSIWFDLIWYKFIYTNLTYIVRYLICADQIMFFSVNSRWNSTTLAWIKNSPLDWPLGLWETSSFFQVYKVASWEATHLPANGKLMVGYVSSQEDWRYEPEKMSGNSVEKLVTFLRCVTVDGRNPLEMQQTLSKMWQTTLPETNIAPENGLED